MFKKKILLRTPDQKSWIFTENFIKEQLIIYRRFIKGNIIKDLLAKLR